MHMKERYFL